MEKVSLYNNNKVDSTKRKLVLYTGKYCKACKEYKPIVEKEADKIGIEIEVYDLHNNNSDPYNTGIMHLPTLALIINDRVWNTLSGAVSEERVYKWIRENIS